MKYNEPFGSADPNASYQDRNTPAAISGSKVPAAAIEHPQREIMAVIAAGGITPSPENLTQLLEAIQNLISAATGGGDTSNFVLMPSARARLPIFPEVMTADGRIPVFSPSAGQVRIPAGYDFLHRGIFNITTVQADFATSANKTYHLRWTASGGFALKDLALTDYNPGAAQETDARFDSAFDDMLIARIVTNASNVPTVTNLANLNAMTFQDTQAGPAEIFSSGTGNDGVRFASVFSYNFARTPLVTLRGTANQTGGPLVHGIANQITDEQATRYGTTAKVYTDFNSAVSPGTAFGELTIRAISR